MSVILVIALLVALSTMGAATAPGNPDVVASIPVIKPYALMSTARFGSCSASITVKPTGF